MTMRLALSRADVTTPDGSKIENAVVLSRMGRLTVQSRHGVQLVDTEATAVAITEPSKMWSVATPEGEYVVSRTKDCGCR